jgi:hypothetical protein
VSEITSITISVPVTNLTDEIARLRSEVAMLRTGDTCARHCEGTAYRIEAQNLRRWKSTMAPRIEALEGLLSAARAEAEAGRKAIATLEGEREANALLTAEIDRLRDETTRLESCLHYEQHRSERIGTHGPGCELWGPAHYECAVRALKELESRANECGNGAGCLHKDALIAAAEARAERLANLLGDIGDRAHDASTGPAVPDALWEIRGMAYEGVQGDCAALAEQEWK